MYHKHLRSQPGLTLKLSLDVFSQLGVGKTPDAGVRDGRVKAFTSRKDGSDLTKPYKSL